MPEPPPNDDARPLVRDLGKPPAAWRRADLVGWCVDHGVRVVNLHHVALDGKLKELRIPVNSRAYLDRVLASGERVDGSNLFPGLFDPGESDLYLVPVYRRAFVNPWSPDELDVVCRYADRDGNPAARTTDNLLAAAASRLRERTGLDLHGLVELEFYIVSARGEARFSGQPQRNYHQSEPFLHSRPIADDILRIVTAITGLVKYCHSEVGYIDELGSLDPELDGRRVEQYELEFDLMPIEDLGVWLAVAKWVARCVAARHGASLTFLPKLDEGMAGSGMHLHLALLREGRNVTADADGELTHEAMGLIGGLLHRAAPLTAFGNTVSASYLRLVPHQEAPTTVCWGRENRSGLVRVPLGFHTKHRMDRVFNPGEDSPAPTGLARPTVEFRSPDASAFSHLLLAAVTMCVEDGLTDPAAIELAKKLEIRGNVFEQPEVLGSLDHLPACAEDAAALLHEHRGFFERGGFPPELLDLVVHALRSEHDEGLSARLRALPAAERLKRSRLLMHKDAHTH